MKASEQTCVHCGKKEDVYGFGAQEVWTVMGDRGDYKFHCSDCLKLEGLTGDWRTEYCIHNGEHNKNPVRLESV